MTDDRVTTLGTGVDGSIRRISLERDVRGLVTKITSYDSASGGNVVNQVERVYNDFSQMVDESQAHDGAVASGTPKVAYAYADGSANHTRMTSMSYPTTRQTSFDYGSSGGMDDSLSRVASLKDGATVMAGYTYVGVDQVVRIDHDEPGVKLTYIAQGSEPVGDGGDIYTGWDRFGRVIDVRWLKSATALERLKYGFDRAGNRQWRKNEVQTTGQDEHYTYDGLYQLKELDRGTLNSGKTAISGTPGWEEDFSFDDIGNWTNYTTKDAGVEQLNQNRGHNVANETTAVAGSSALVGYDDAGNMTKTPKVSAWGSAFDLVWDAWNRLVEVKDGSTSKGVYAYDGLGRRVTKTIGVTVRHYYYSDQWQVLEERVGTSDDADRQFVWGLRYPDDLVLRDSNKNGTLDERLYSLSDYFNISVIVNATGTVLERYGYDAYGKSREMTASFGSRGSTDYDWKIRYKGVILDEESGFYQVRYRYLHPGLGRWLSRDPIGEQGGLNLYAFVENNPGNAWDWLGLYEVSFGGGAYVGLGGEWSLSETEKKEDCCKDGEWIKNGLTTVTQELKASVGVGLGGKISIGVRAISLGWRGPRVRGSAKKTWKSECGGRVEREPVCVSLGYNAGHSFSAGLLGFKIMGEIRVGGDYVGCYYNGKFTWERVPDVYSHISYQLPFQEPVEL